MHKRRTAGRLALGFGGLVLAFALGVVDDVALGQGMIARLDQQTQALLVGRGVQASFVDGHGWLTRHVALWGGDGLSDATRAGLAAMVAQVPGMGGVRWSGRHVHADFHNDPRADAGPGGTDCAADVAAILKTRTLRFAENSAAIDPVSKRALDEVAGALRPCAGSVIAITGHTDARGDETFNQNLSHERALAVRNALGQRGIDIADLRARGMGSARGIPGLEADDPANRRIEFAMIAPVSAVPTMVDVPGADPARGGDVLGTLPLWLELGVLAALTYALGLGIGWAIWARRAA